MHHGRIVKRTGDGSIIEFRSVVDAVNLAIEVQRAMVERNAEVAPDKRIEFRIGIHLGDVVEESDGDLMGDGVNIAARLEGLAKPGGICISDDAYRQVKSRLDLKVSDLGPVPLKNIAEPMRAYSLEVGVPAQAKPALAVTAAVKPGSAATAARASGLLSRWPMLVAALALALLAAGAYAWHAGYALRLPGPYVAEDKLKTAPRLSLVVLPFENLGGDPEQQYFADGITDDLTTDLSHVPDSFVIARDTAFTSTPAVCFAQKGRQTAHFAGNLLLVGWHQTPRANNGGRFMVPKAGQSARPQTWGETRHFSSSESA